RAFPAHHPWLPLTPSTPSKPVVGATWLPLLPGTCGTFAPPDPPHPPAPPAPAGAARSPRSEAGNAAISTGLLLFIGLGAEHLGRIIQGTGGFVQHGAQGAAPFASEALAVVSFPRHAGDQAVDLEFLVLE